MKRASQSQSPGSTQEWSYRSVRPRTSRRTRRMKIPKAIATRGTPRGYYEIPVTNRCTFAFDKAGIKITDQTTYATTGTGFRGGGLWFTLADINMNMGEGTIANFQGISVPGFASLQEVFDMCKVAYVDVEVRFNLAPREISNTTAFYSPACYLAVDPDDAQPPTNLNAILQYNKVYKVVPNSFYDKPVRIRIYPKSRLDVGSTSEESGSTTTLAVSQPSTYMDIDRPLGAMFGLKFWVDLPGSTATTDMFGQITFDIKQCRRYKVTK